MPVRDRTTETLQLLNGVRNLLINCMDYEATIQEVANLLVSSLAEWCAVDLVDIDKKIVRVAVTHRDPAKADLTREILLNYPSKPEAKRGVYKVIETGRAILIPHTTESSWAARAENPRHLEIIMELGSTSYMCIPLLARGRTIGSIMLLASYKVFDEQDLRAGEEVAQIIALAVDNVVMFKKMQNAIRVRDEFMATLSHELRTPLNVILGWVQILKAEKLDHASFKNVLDILERNSQLHARMINDLLDLTRIVAQKISLDAIPLDISKILQTAVEAMSIQAKEKKVNLITDLNGITAIVRGDASHLERMFFNLLTNAIKFTPSEGMITVSLKIIEENAVITVRDSGIGIDTKFLPYVFEALRQENSASNRSHQGLGLGLAIAKHIVDSHRGKIEVKSEGRGLGSEFVIHLPLSEQIQQTKEQNEKPTESCHQECHSIMLTGYKIMVVDDSDDIRNLLSKYLELGGAEVIAVGSALEALDILNHTIPDVLVSDISMPEVDGYTLIKKIRNSSNSKIKNIKAIALTAYAKEVEEKKSLEFGFDLHLSKPISAKTLRQSIVYLLGERIARHCAQGCGGPRG